MGHRKGRKPPIKQDIPPIHNEQCGFGDHKDIAIRLLDRTLRLLEEFEINYLLISGALLGHVRHGDFIPWDDDIDLLVDTKMQSKAPNIAKRHSELISMMYNKSYGKICFKNQGVEIPENPCVLEWRKHMLTKKGKYCWPFIDLFEYRLTGNQIHFFNKSWVADKFLPAKKQTFLGIELNVPNDPDYFLRLNYGNNYMTKFEPSSFCHKTETRIRRKLR